MAQQNPARNHHYLPQCLLKRFASKSGMLWEYDTDARTIEHRHKSKTGFQPDLYTRKADSPNPDFETIEKSLFGVIESPGSIALDLIEAKRPLKQRHCLAFLNFAASLHHRTPAFFDFIRDIQSPLMEESFRRVSKFSTEYRDRLRKRFLAMGTTEEEISELFGMFDRDECTVKPATEFVMALALRATAETLQIFARMKWAFMSVPRGGVDLVLGDHPLTLLDCSTAQPPNLGLLNPRIEIALPIGRRTVAIGGWKPRKLYAELPKGASSEINDRTFRFAKQYVFGHEFSKDVMDRALILKGTGPKVRVESFKLENGGLAFKTDWHQPA